MVFGQVGIDMIAGPSEVLIIADGTGDAAHAAADLLAQAEHDEMAGAVLLTPDEAFAGAVDGGGRPPARKSPAEGDRLPLAGGLRGFGGHARSRRGGRAGQPFRAGTPRTDGANPRELLAEIRNAGAIFMGMHTPEALGDYTAGPNHVLPTGGTARFASPLGVYDFVKRTSVLSFRGRRSSGTGVQPPVSPKWKGSTDTAIPSVCAWKKQGGSPRAAKKILTKWSC